MMFYLKVGLIFFILVTANCCRYCSRTKHRPKPSDTDAILKEFPTIINDIPQGCDSEIYCTGELLNDASLLGFNYLQKKIKQPERSIITRFKIMKARNHGAITYTDMENFINEHFEDKNELEIWSPPDFNENPTMLDKIADADYKVWASDLNQIWKILARKVSSDVEENPDRYSLIYVPNGFIIPGGIFKELYYWDTYWIVNGLLLCDMHDTARGVIENLLYLLKRYGYIPNANRRYYLDDRSQPPLLIRMVESYYEKTKDEQFLRNVITELSYELNYWINYRLVSVEWNDKEYIMARYFVDSEGPRPESYSNDYMNARIFSTDEEKNKFYINIKSAAESGMDFTSRWFIKNKSNAGNISNIATTDIIPVDLNAMLHYNAKKLSEWYYMLGDKMKGGLYEVFSNVLLQGINEVLWDNDEGMWFDFDNANKKKRKYFYASNMVPLWTGSYPTHWSKHDLTDNVISYLNRMGIDNFNGVPNSLMETGEQWDFPNAWPPMQSIIVEGLDALGTPEAKIKAYELAKKWIETNYAGFKRDRVMYEKYSVVELGESGSGGEYSPQNGFGWTNGVVLQFLDKYSNIIETGL